MKKILLLFLPVTLMIMACDNNGSEDWSMSQAGEPERRVDTITAATYNVDGLPNSLDISLGDDAFLCSLVKSAIEYFPTAPVSLDEDNVCHVIMNQDGPGERGSAEISRRMMDRRWDVFGLNEDFNYQSASNALDFVYEDGKPLADHYSV